MIWHRLTQNYEGLLEGSTLSDERFKSVGYLGRHLFESLNDFELKDLIEYENQVYCIENGIDKILFYNQQELDNFLTKIEDCAVD